MGPIAVALTLLALWLEMVMGLRISSERGLSLLNLALATLLATWFLMSLRTRSLLRPHPANKWLFLLMLYYAALIPVKVLMGEVHVESMWLEFLDLKNWCNPFLLFFACLQVLEKPKDVNSGFLALCLLLAATLSASAILAALGGEFGSFRSGKDNRLGGFSEPNQYAATLALFLPLIFGGVKYARSAALRAAAALFGAIGVAALLLTGSRGGLVALFVALMVWFVIGRNRTLMPKEVPSGTGRLAAIVVVTVAIGLFFGSGQDFQALFERSNDPSASGVDAYTSGRLGIYKAGLEIFAEQPVFGHGAGTFPYLLEFRTGNWQNSHNDYLLFLVEGGVFGLFLWIGALRSVWSSVSRFLTEMVRDWPNRWVVVAYLSGFAGYATSMLTVNLIEPRYLFWFYTALVVRLGADPLYKSEGAAS